MNIFEYNEEKVLRMTKEEGYEIGYESGYDTGYDSGSQDGEMRGEIRGRCIDVRDGVYSMEYASKRLNISLEQFECYFEEFVKTGKIEIKRVK
jgi:flagellar biosynthesis/type III secretory pathway protein FliH